MSSSTNDTNEDLVDELADEFVSRHQNGEAPSVAEYCERHPEVADEIAELFPLLVMLEGTKSPSTKSGVVSKKVGDYELIDEIGRGGMGIVYEAKHESLGRRVAVKVLPTQLADSPKAVARFQREAKAISNLHHTNIVPLYEVGASEGQFYFAMQLIEGQSLDVAVSQAKSNIAVTLGVSDFADTKSDGFEVGSRVSTIRVLFESADKSGVSGSSNRSMYGWVAKLGTQIADALQYAHDQGIVHRDVKPSNILLDENAAAWLTDFGLAKLEGEDLTQTGDIVGTLRYMSPERFTGKCDERADIYGLGLTLYEILAMQPAFQTSDRMSLIDQICNSRPLRLRDLIPQLPRDLETIVFKACDPEPAARYQSAAALASDLRNFIADRPIKARRATVFEQAWRWSRRNRAIAAAIALAVASLVLLTIVSTFNSIREKGLRAEAEIAQQKSESRGKLLESQKKEMQGQAVVLRQQSNKLQTSLYHAQVNLAGVAAAKDSGVETIRARLASTHPSALGNDLRGWEWYFLHSLVNQDAFTSTEQPDQTREVCYSPDGTRIVNSVRGHGIQLRDAKTGKVMRFLKLSEVHIGEHNVRWSPDGKSIASSDFLGHISIADSETLERKQKLRDYDSMAVEMANLSWSSDSERLASTIPQRKEVVIWDVASGKRERTIRLDEECFAVQWSPAEDIVAVRTESFTRIYDVESGEVLAEFENHSPDRGEICWSPDGSKLATSMPVRVIDWEAREVIAKGPECTGSAVAWRPGYDQVLYLSHDGITLWDVDAQETIRSFYGQAFIDSLCFSPDGKNIASSGRDRTVRIWKVDTRAPIVETRADGRNDSIDWDPSGRALIGNSSRNFANVWDMPNSQVIQRPFAPPDQLETNRLWAIAVNQTDGRVAFGGSNSNVRVWDRRDDSGEVYEGAVGETKRLAWSTDGRLAAISWPPSYDLKKKTAYPKTGSYLVVWDQDGKKIGEPTLIGHGLGRGLAWSADATKIATAASDRMIRVWESETLQVLREIKMPSSMDEDAEVCFSPDGNRLAIANQPAVFVWETETGQMLGKMDEIRENFRCLDWSPDGRRLAVGSDDSISVWDTEHYRLALKIQLAVDQVRWAPDGLRLAVSYDEKFRVFDATGGYQLEGIDLPNQPSPIPDTISTSASRRSEVAEILQSDEWTWSEPVVLSDSVNSPHNDYEPFVSEDGLELYFNSDRPGGQGGHDLYVSRRKSLDDDWGVAENIGTVINSSANEEAAHVTADGLSLYFNSNRGGDNDLFVARRATSNEAWGEPQRLPFPINSDATDIEPTLSQDGLTLLFVSTRSNKFELFISQRESTDEPWGAPKKLRGDINSADWQGSPSILSDEAGTVVVFHSSEAVKIASRNSSGGPFVMVERLSDADILGSVYSPFLCKDGRTLYYRRSDGDQFDIWMSKRVKSAVGR